MHIPRLLTLLALLSFVAACDGSPDTPAPTPAPAPSPEQRPPPSVDVAPDASARSAYANSSYDYCDAKMLALVWNQGIRESKVTLGNKVLAGLTDLADLDIAAGRKKALAQFDTNPGMRCSYEEAGYSYDDAVALGAHWGIDSWEAKIRIERKLLWGDEGIVQSELLAAKR